MGIKEDQKKEKEIDEAGLSAGRESLDFYLGGFLFRLLQGAQIIE